jgi:TRAP-type C4-dicarboxylate transport system substrate-binding protein
MPSTETYQGIQRGTMDGVSFPLYGYSAFKIDELSDWYSDDIKFGRAITVSLVNKDAFESLPEQYQMVLNDSIPLANAALIEAYGDIESTNYPNWLEMGVTNVDFTPSDVAAMEAEARPIIFADWVATANDRGIAGQDIIDFLMEAAAN